MALLQRTKPFSSTAARPRQQQRCAVRVAASCQRDGGAPAAARRDVLLAGAAAAAAPLLLQASPAAAALREMPVSGLSTFQRAAQRQAVQAAAEGVLRTKFSAPDTPQLVALILHDAATYDAAAKTGGYDGSILVSSEELSRPENAYLKPMAARVREAKAAVDAALPEGSGPLSNADTLLLACKVATQAAWREAKLKKTQTTSGGDIITRVYGTEWPVRLGRLDSDTPGPGRLPALDAPVADITAFFKALGVKPGSESSGPFARKPPFWERPLFVLWPAAAADPAAEEARFVAENGSMYGPFKTEYDRSRASLTRTDYEVDFINFLDKATSLGAKFNPDAYLHPETTLQLKF